MLPCTVRSGHGPTPKQPPARAPRSRCSDHLCPSMSSPTAGTHRSAICSEGSRSARRPEECGTEGQIARRDPGPRGASRRSSVRASGLLERRRPLSVTNAAEPAAPVLSWHPSEPLVRPRVRHQSGACRHRPQLLVPSISIDVEASPTTSRRPVGCPGPSDDRDARGCSCRHPPDAIGFSGGSPWTWRSTSSCCWRPSSTPMNSTRARDGRRTPGTVGAAPHRPADATRHRARGQPRRRRPRDAATNRTPFSAIPMTTPGAAGDHRASSRPLTARDGTERGTECDRAARARRKCVNTYDPDDDVLYVHLPLAGVSCPLPHSPDGRRTHPLPCGYANRSPATRLRVPVPGSLSDPRRNSAEAERRAADPRASGS